MRILLITNSYPTVAAPGGANYVPERVRQLRAIGRVTVDALALCPRYGSVISSMRRLVGAAGHEDLLPADNDAGRSFVAVSCPWTVRDVVRSRRGRVSDRLVDIVANRVVAHVTATGRRFDVIHAHGMYALPAGEVAMRVGARLGVPVVVSMHGSDVTGVMPHATTAFVRTLAAAAATIYVSEALRATAVGLGAPREGSYVIPNGVNTSLFHPGTARRPVADAHPAAAGEPGTAGRSAGDAHPAAAEEPGVTAGASVLFVGNLLPVKGADLLPAIARRLQQLRPGTSLSVIGDGPLRASLERKMPPGVVFHGRVEPQRVADAMRRSDVLVVPSRQEGWGCVITESYACGTPVAATSVGGIPEAVLDTAALVPAGPTVVDGLAHRIVDLLDHPPEAAAMAAHVAGRGWADVVRAELAVLTSVTS